MSKLQLVKSEKFGTVKCDFYSNSKDVFMTIEQLGECLEYANGRKGIDNLIDRNEYIKSEEFSVTLKMRATDGKQYNTRIFTEDGIYEVTMLSKTEKAKEFRSWVRKILKSLRTGQAILIPTAQLEQIRVEASKQRAQAMLLNAQNRALKTIMSTIDDKKISPIAAEVFGLTAIEQLTGKQISYRPECEPTYSATEIANAFGTNKNRVGKVANANNLKTDEYGITVLDKSPYSSKEVPSFRYNAKGKEKIGELLEGERK